MKKTPFVARKQELVDNLNLKISNVQVLFHDWFLAVKAKGFQVRLCPDILYLTNEAKVTKTSKKDLQPLAESRRVMAVSTYNPPSATFKFNCSEVGLSCDPFTASDNHVLVPWCCAEATIYMLRVFDNILTELGFHYEMTTGTLLGAVKLSNFIPWDIDGDTYIPTKAMPHFQKGQKGYNLLEEAGITGMTILF